MRFCYSAAAAAAALYAANDRSSLQLSETFLQSFSNFLPLLQTIAFLDLIAFGAQAERGREKERRKKVLLTSISNLSQIEN